MTRKETDILLALAGAALIYVGDKTFAEQGHRDTAGSTGASLAGVGLAAYGLYRFDRGWGQLAALGLGSLVAYNFVKREPGQPAVSLGPLHFPKALRA